MEAFLQFIQNKAPFLIDHIYIFLFLGGALEGLNTLILGGFLSSLGQIKLIYIFPVLVLAHMANGYLWYSVGYLGGAKSIEKWVYRDKKGKAVMDKIYRYFQRYSGRAIMIAKFTFSLDIATMVLSGALKYNLKKFSRYNFWGSAGWVTITFFVGYFFGRSFKAIFEAVIKNLTMGIVFLGGAISLIYVLSILFKKYYVAYLNVAEKFRHWRDNFWEKLDKFINNGNGKNGK